MGAVIRIILSSFACALVFATGQGVCSASSPASSVSFEGPQAQVKFSRKASDGYSIFFEMNRGKASLSAEGNEGSAIYKGKGSLVDGHIHFGLGKLGVIDARFKPNGSVDRIRPPKTCKGREQLVRNGIFVGSIKFRGENGYTRLNVRRVYGTMASPRSWKCPDASGKHPGNTVDLPAALGAFTPHRHVVFVAIGASELLPFRYFIAGTSERQGGLSINRSALVEGKAASFEASKDLSSATVAPPKPFAGTASFRRNADGSKEWSGTLSVALPGIESTPLTGPAFTTNLARPKSDREFSELLGLG